MLDPKAPASQLESRAHRPRGESSSAPHPLANGHDSSDADVSHHNAKPTINTVEQDDDDLVVQSSQSQWLLPIEQEPVEQEDDGFVPSSQSQLLLPMEPEPVQQEDDGPVPSSQSQYLLPMEDAAVSSPEIHPDHEIIASSQSHPETELIPRSGYKPPRRASLRSSLLAPALELLLSLRLPQPVSQPEPRPVPTPLREAEAVQDGPVPSLATSGTTLATSGTTVLSTPNAVEATEAQPPTAAIGGVDVGLADKTAFPDATTEAAAIVLLNALGAEPGALVGVDLAGLNAIYRSLLHEKIAAGMLPTVRSGASAAAVSLHPLAPGSSSSGQSPQPASPDKSNIAVPSAPVPSTSSSQLSPQQPASASPYKHIWHSASRAPAAALQQEARPAGERERGKGETTPASHSPTQTGSEHSSRTVQTSAAAAQEAQDAFAVLVVGPRSGPVSRATPPARAKHRRRCRARRPTPLPPAKKPTSLTSNARPWSQKSLVDAYHGDGATQRRIVLCAVAPSSPSFSSACLIVVTAAGARPATAASL
ncbi:hypothetical protein B0H14DRAFT_711179 [Mycena olivaceomarginata]|nr:hypothetical protein B0H14DRAFT_711179 [Mycena olivaceomarginata]